MNRLTTRLAIRLVLAIVSQTPVHAADCCPSHLFKLPNGALVCTTGMTPVANAECQPSPGGWACSDHEIMVQTSCPLSHLGYGCAPPSCIDPQTGNTRMEDENFSCDGHDFGRARP